MQLRFPDVIDSSMLGTYKACGRKFYLTFLEHLKPKEPNVHLHAGKSFASGIERARRAFYEEGKDSESSVAEGLTTLMREYGDFSCPPEESKSLERMAGALEFYFTNYPLEHDSAVPLELSGGKRAIEFSFSLPLPIRNPDTGDPILYCGRMDAITAFAGGAFVTDEKTTKSLGPSWARQWDLRSQFTGYCWGAREHGIRADGVLVRGVSILKTKYDTQQAVSYRPDWQIDRWYNQMLFTVREIVNQYLDAKPWVNGIPDGVFQHNLDDACTSYGQCGFYDACRSEDPSTWLVTNFERKLWNPLLRTETKIEE